MKNENHLSSHPEVGKNQVHVNATNSYEKLLYFLKQKAFGKSCAALL